MRTCVAGAVLVMTFLAIYLPDAGHGFIKDDFTWIANSRSSSMGDVAGLFSKNSGFYRPLVAISFAADYAMWREHAFGYALTNLTICALNAWLLFLVGRTLGLGRESAMFAAALWAFNFHGINMSVLWLSGRTALLVTMFALAATYALLRDWRKTAGLLTFGAMLCKEEAVVLPAVFAAFVAVDDARTRAVGRVLRSRPAADGGSKEQDPPYMLIRERVRRALIRTWPVWVPLVIYTLLRIRSGAFWPSSAPTYYRFSLTLPTLLRNAAEYADRAGTVAALVALALVAVARFTRPQFTVAERRVLLFSALWVPATYVLTVPLPIRSSLYALLPSVGTTLAAAAVASWAARTSPVRFRFVATALVATAVLLIPVYRVRNERWVNPADVSFRVMQSVRDVTAGHPAGGRIVLIDDAAEQVTLDDAFSGTFADALSITLGPRWSGAVVATGDPVVNDAATTLVFKLHDGALTKVERGDERW